IWTQAPPQRRIHTMRESGPFKRGPKRVVLTTCEFGKNAARRRGAGVRGAASVGGDQSFGRAGGQLLTEARGSHHVAFRLVLGDCARQGRSPSIATAGPRFDQ